MRKMRKFAKGGSADRAQSRYDRMTKDIESDYEKAKSRKTGRALEVAKAKYEQRMADARDDRAKARGEDRTATRAAEKAAERNLRTTRRYGASKTAAAVGASEPIAKPMSTSQISEAVASKPAATPTSGGSFSEAFRAARKGGDKTFTWRGKSYSTRMAGEGASRPGTTRGAAAPTAAAPVASDRPKKDTPSRVTPAAAAPATNDRPKKDTPSRVTPAAAASATNDRPKKVGASAAPAKTSADRQRDLAAEARQRAAAREKLERSSESTGETRSARLRAMLGLGSAGERRMAGVYERAAAQNAQREQRARWADVEEQGRRAAEAYRRKQRAEAGKKPGASRTERFYAENPTAMAKGGKIDGAAVRGKTRAKRK